MTTADAENDVTARGLSPLWPNINRCVRLRLNMDIRLDLPELPQ